jgi:hypothetical protein
MASPLETTLLVVGGAALLAFLMRGFGKKEEAGERTGGTASPAYAPDEEFEGPIGEIVALTSDGLAFIPDRDLIRLVPSGEDEPDVPASLGSEMVPSSDRPGRHGGPVHPRSGRAMARMGEQLVPGDLVAARVRRGAPDHDPWRLEALGRDREYRVWRFETEEAAHAAMALLDGRIVRAPRDRDGELVSIGDVEFEEARRIEEETEAELAQFDPEGEAGSQDYRY